MPINKQEIIHIISHLDEVSNLKVTLHSSAKGAVITGGSTFLGGVLLGPVGLVLGGLAGVAATASRGYQFRSVPNILMNDLTTAQQGMLFDRMKNVFQDFGIEDAVAFSALLLSNNNFKMLVVEAVSNFIKSDLQMQLM